MESFVIEPHCGRAFCNALPFEFVYRIIVSALYSNRDLIYAFLFSSDNTRLDFVVKETTGMVLLLYIYFFFRWYIWNYCIYCNKGAKFYMVGDWNFIYTYSVRASANICHPLSLLPCKQNFMNSLLNHKIYTISCVCIWLS